MSLFLVWGLVLLAGAMAFRSGQLKLFGPILYYDLVRTSRRARFMLVRFAYGLFLTCFLILAYAFWFVQQEGYHDLARISRFSAGFFWAFMIVQFLFVLLMTPAYTAGALAEEKERGTLDALFATALTNHEIVLGLYIARLAKLGMLLLASLPILSIVQFMGGIEPGLILAGFAALGLTLAGLGGLSIMNSLVCPRPLDAMLRTYALALAYLFLSGLSKLLLWPTLKLASFPSTAQWKSPVTLEDVIGFLNAGNMITATFDLASGVAAGSTLDALLPSKLAAYAVFHGIIAVGCCAWAVRSLRRRVLEPEKSAVADHLAHSHEAWRGLLHARPMLWKELIANTPARRSVWGRLWTGGWIALLFVPAAQVCFYFGRLVPAADDERMRDMLSLWARAISTVVGSLLLLQIAIRASGTVSRERDKQTLDSLLTTPLTLRSIILAKWLGCLFGGRMGWLTLALVWLLGVFTGAVHPVGILVFVLIWLVYASFMGSVGIWSSVVSSSTRNAIFLTFALFAIMLFCGCLAAFDVAGNNLLNAEEGLLFIPPAAFYMLLASPGQVRMWLHDGVDLRLVGIAIVMAIWLAGSAVALCLAVIRFGAMTGRNDAGRPERISQGPDWKKVIRRTWASLWSSWREWIPDRRAIVRSLGNLTIVLLPLLCLAFGYSWMAYREVSKLRAIMAELDQTDPGWRLEEIQAARAAVPDDRNGALVVLAAAERLPPERWMSQNSLLARKGSDLVAARGYIGRLKDYPSGRFPDAFFPPDQNEQSLGIYRFAEGAWILRRVFSQLSLQAQFHANAVNLNRVLEDYLACLGAADSIGDECNSSAPCLRVSLHDHIYHQIKLYLDRDNLNERGAIAFHERLLGEELFPYELVYLRGERAQYHRHLQSRNPYRANIRRPGAKVSWLPSWENWSAMMTSSPGSALISHPEGLQYWTSQIEKLRAALTSYQIQKITATVLVGLPATLRGSVLGHDSGAVSDARNRAQMAAVKVLEMLGVRQSRRSLLVAMALVRYRSAKGDWPNSLAELTPDYLREIPLDPIDGSSLSYMRFQEGVLIYFAGAPKPYPAATTFNLPPGSCGIRLRNPE